MKSLRNMNSKTSIIISICLLLIAGLGCKQIDSLTTEEPPPPSVPTEKDAPSKPITGNTNSATDISGEYSATGKNINGGGNYKADLVITNRDDVYQFSWQSGRNKYEGIGVQTNDKVAVAFADGADGKGCGVVLYKINSDGSLEGTTGYWGVNETESETATPRNVDGLKGSYDVEGINLKGENYEMKLTVSKQNDGYKFDWQGNRKWQGIGVKQGDTISVGFGDKKCGFVAYEINSDGSIEGKWGGQNTKTFGTEKAVKN